MNCPKCDSETKITKVVQRRTKVIRTRLCLAKQTCGYRFFTEELHLKESTRLGSIATPKLTPDQVAEIRWLTQNTKMRYRAIGEHYSINYRQVSKIGLGYSWPTVAPVPPAWYEREPEQLTRA